MLKSGCPVVATNFFLYITNVIKIKNIKVMTIKKNELIYTMNILRALEASHYDHRELTNKESYELTTMAVKFFNNNRNKLTARLIYEFSEKLIRKFLSFHKTYWSDTDIEKCVKLVMASQMLKKC